MKQALIAPQFGFAARPFADDVQDPPPIEPAAPSTVAYSGSSVFRPTTEPTVVVKAVKRRRINDGTVADGAESATLVGGQASPVSGAGAARGPKVFLRAPSRPAPSPAAGGRPEPSAACNEVGAESFDSAPAASPPATRKHRRARNPLAAPVLIRHVVFERDEGESRERPAFDGNEAAPAVASYLSVTRALEQLREKVAALVRVHEGLAELDELTSLRAVGAARTR